MGERKQPPAVGKSSGGKGKARHGRVGGKVVHRGSHPHRGDGFSNITTGACSRPGKGFIFPREER